MGQQGECIMSINEPYSEACLPVYEVSGAGIEEGQASRAIADKRLVVLQRTDALQEYP